MGWDVELFRLLNGRLTHPGLDWLMPILTSSSTYRLPALALLLALLVRGTPRQRKALLGLALCVGLCDLVSSRMLKPLFDRPRPGWTLEGVRLLLAPKHSASFPSSHAVNLAAAGWFLVRNGAPRWLSAAMLCAVVVISYSRIYVGVHYPSDVLGGALLGAGMAELWARVWRRIGGAPEPALAHSGAAAQNPSSEEGDSLAHPKPAAVPAAVHSEPERGPGLDRRGDL